MRVSLAPAHLRPDAKAPEQERAPQPLLAAKGPRVVLGGGDGGALARPIAPAADTLFGPRGACLAAEKGPLFVCDTGHHRLMVWNRTPEADGAPADILIGQPDFSREGRNAKGDVTAASLNVPTGVAACKGVLAVADAWNHRVLIWHGYPDHSGRPADVVLGQADFSGGLANRGASAARADTLNWCYGVAILDCRLFVADTGNRRVLVWDGIPKENGAPADLVLGQEDFTTRDENAGGKNSALGMRWPHGIATGGGAIFVTDAGNNRIMVWNRLPSLNGVPCDFVIGQSEMSALDHNRAAYYPTAAALNMPYGIAVHKRFLAVADTANSRLLGYDPVRLGMGASAARLTGQRAFSDKGDNRWNFPVRDSLCWPYNIAVAGETVVVSDSGNNRVLLWETAP